MYKGGELRSSEQIISFVHPTKRDRTTYVKSLRYQWQSPPSCLQRLPLQVTVFFLIPGDIHNVPWKIHDHGVVAEFYFCTAEVQGPCEYQTPDLVPNFIRNGCHGYERQFFLGCNIIGLDGDSIFNISATYDDYVR